MEIATLRGRALNVIDAAADPNFLAAARELLDSARIGLTRLEYLVSARRQLAHIVTDRLTPWLEPYHAPEDHS